MPTRSLIGFCLASVCVYLIARGPAAPEGPALSIQSHGQRRGRRPGPTRKSLQSRQEVRRNGKKRILVTYRWLDPHHFGITKWKGDTAHLDPRAPKRYLDVALEIDPERLERARESFGVVKSWLKTRPRDAGESAWIDQAARRGIILAPEDNRIRVSVDHPWVVRHSTDDVRPATKALTRLWRVKAYLTKRELLALIASFCQSMEYKTPPSERTNAAGQMVVTTGVTMPLETLHNGWGDCDTKSLLFAAILANVPKQRVVFLTGKGHLFVGVRTVPRKDDHFIELQGARYILIEMTSPWPIGRVPGKQMAGWRTNSFRVTRVW